MRTVRTKVYKFSELSKEAKENAIEWFRNNRLDFQYLSDEAYESVKKFEKIFSMDIRQMDWEEMYRSEWRFELDDTILELTGQRLATYIWNNYRTDLFKGKFYNSWTTDKRIQHRKVKSQLICKENGWSNKEIYGKYYNQYYGLKLEHSCVLTGVCWDDSLLQPIYEFLDKPSDRIDFKQLLEECLYSVAKDVSCEIEARSEDDAIAEEIEANEYEFTKDGKRFHS